MADDLQSLQARIAALENEVNQTKVERDMWKKQSETKSTRNESTSALHTTSKKLSRPQSVAFTRGGSTTRTEPNLSAPHSPSSIPPNRMRSVSSSFDGGQAKNNHQFTLRTKNSIARIAPHHRANATEYKKASFDIIKCTDEICELVKVKNGLITTSHQDTTTAKLMWKDRPTRILLVKKPEDTPSTELMLRCGDYLVNKMQFTDVVVDPLVIAELNDDKTELCLQLKQYLRAYTDIESKNLHRHVDLVVTIGGDGTVLWTGQLFEGPCPPVISFSMGSMGFLTPFHADDYQKVLTNVVEKGCFLSVRSRVQGEIQRLRVDKTATETKETKGSNDNNNDDDDDDDDDDDENDDEDEEVTEFTIDDTSSLNTATPTTSTTTPNEIHSVLNEIVVDRGPASTLGNLMSYCNGQLLTRVQADGIIIGTPTGSTAYSLSAGGSIVHPAVPSMVFTPICPHTLSFRSMIFPDSVTLKVVVPSDSRCTAWASFDGKHRTELKRGDSLSMTVSRFPIPLICKISEQSDWLESVKEQLFWNMRIVQKKKEK